MLLKHKSTWSAALALALLLAAPPQASAQQALTDTDVTFTHGDQTLHGTIVAPADTGSDLPGVVIVAGAGSTERGDYRREAEAFARAGIVSLIYDKRVGYSRATSTFDDLAADALAGVRLLRSHPGVAPSLVGLWGHSQGGWVVPLAASQSDEVAFVVTVAASALGTGRTQLWSNGTHLAHAGVSPRLIDPIGRDLSRLLIAADLFGDTGYDPVAGLARVRQPLLGVFAEHDRSTAPGESLVAFKQALDDGGNTHYTLRVVRDAGHTMRHSADGFPGSASADFAPGYLDLVTSWVNDLAAGPPRASADAPPAQDSRSEPVAPVAWYESPAVQVGAILLMLVAFLAYPVTAIVRRARRISVSPRRSARVLSAAGPLIVLGTLAYLMHIVATGATAVRDVVLERPLPWLLLQVLTVVVLIAAATVAAHLFRERARPGPDRVRLAVLIAGALVFVPWAAYWGLLTI